MYPDSFYYDLEADKDFSSKPNGGIPNATLMAQGKPCWPAGYKIEKKPRSLIFADWTASHWSKNKIHLVLSQLLKLSQDKFLIYLWQNGVLHPLNYESINFLYVNNLFLDSYFKDGAEFPDEDDESWAAQINQALVSELKKAAYDQHGINPDHLLILDDHQIRQLLNLNDPNQGRVVLLSDLAAAEDTQYVIDCLKQAKPSVTEVVDYQLNAENNLKFLKKQGSLPWPSNTFPKAYYHPAENPPVQPINTNLFLNSLSEKEQFELFENLDFAFDVTCVKLLKKIEPINETFYNQLFQTCFLKKLTINDSQLIKPIVELAQLNELEELNIEKSEDKKFLHDLPLLLNACSQLNILRIDVSSGINSFENFPELLTVETLILKNVSSSEDLSFFLQKFPNLKNLKTNSCALSKILSLKNLEIVYVNDLRNNYLERLLADSSRLISLFISKLVIVNEETAVNLQLTNLSRLTISEGIKVKNSDEKIATFFLNQLLRQTIHLKELRLGSVNIFKKELFSNVFATKLEQFIATDIFQFDADIINQFLKQSNRLTTIRYTALPSNKVHLIDCSHLIDLKMDEQPAQVWYFLTHAEHLTKLQLTKVGFSSHVVKDEILSLGKLREAQFENCQFSSQLFFSLFEESINLSVLKCQNVTFLTNELPAVLNLSALKELEIDNCTVWDENFYKLVKNATYLRSVKLKNIHLSVHWLNALAEAKQLTDLTLRHTTGLAESLITISEAFTLPALRFLDLQRSDISHKNLLIILSHVTHLKGLDIRECYNVDSNSPEITLCLSRLPEKAALKKTNKRKASESSTYFQTRALSIQTSPVYEEVLPRFNYLYFLDKQPPEEENSFFHYQHISNRKGQDAFIMQFTQYCFLTGANYSFHKIKEGMCFPLCLIDQELGITTLDPIFAWDGDIESLQSNPMLNYCLGLLKNYYQKCYFSKNILPKFYLGEQLSWLLQEAVVGDKFYLANSWHAISIKKIDEGSWHFYDPNWVPYSVSDEEIQEKIEHSLGKLVSYKNQNFYSKLVGKKRIKNPPEFIRDGGLLELTREDSLMEAFQHYENFSFKANELEGILIHDLWGAPAWIDGLKTDHTCYLSIYLLKLFIQTVPNSLERLQAGIAPISFERKEKYLKLIKSIIEPKDILFCNKLITLILTSSNAYYFKKELAPKRAKPPFFHSVESYCVHLITSNTSRQLITLQDDISVYNLSLSLRRAASKLSRPVYLVNSLDDLIFSAPYLKVLNPHYPLNQRRAVIKRGPGGKALDFFEENGNFNPIILVNCTLFKGREIVAANTNFEQEGYLDKLAIPHGTQLIVLQNVKSPDAYQGVDFYSRFVKHISECPFSSQVLQKEVGQIHWLPKEYVTSFYPVNFLTQEKNWKEVLLGKWVLDGDAFHFLPGELFQAGSQRLPMVLLDAPWDNPAFNTFLLELAPNTWLNHEGQWLFLGDYLNFTSLDQNEYPQFHYQIGENYDPNGIDINPTDFHEIFEQQYCDEQGKYHYLPGHFKRAAGERVVLNETYPLHQEQKVALLREAQKYRVNLLINFPKPAQIDDRTLVFQTNEQDIVVRQLVSKNPDSIVIDVTQYKSSDLLTHLTGNFEKKTCHFNFWNEQGLINAAFEKEKTVILMGEFSAELVAGLSSYILKRLHSSVKMGTLIIVTQNIESFYFVAPYPWLITNEEKKVWIDKLQANWQFQQSIFSEDDYINKSYAQLRNTMVSHYLHPSPRNPQINTNLNTARLQMLETVFSIEPVAILSGKNVTGKTTFLNNCFAMSKKVAGFYRGGQSLASWAFAKSDSGFIVLYLNSSNLSQLPLSLFEELYFNRWIPVDDHFVQVSPWHVVLIELDFTTYHAHLPAFLKRHNNLILFDPLPLEIILKENFHTLIRFIPATQAQRVMKEILFYYDFLSPRDVEMLVLLVLSEWQRDPSKHPVDLAMQWANQYALLMTPSNKLIDFKKKFPQSNQKSPRKMVKEFLNAFLWVREFKQKNNAIHSRLASAGIKACFLMGESSVGKSYLVLEILKENGYQELQDWKAKNIPKKAYFKMPASWPDETKKQLEKRAAKYEFIIVADELNSSPLDEEGLSNILSGRTPNGQFELNNPGFAMISTGNPPSYEGRAEENETIAKYFLHLTVPDFTQEEIEKILKDEGLEDQQAQTLAKVFQEEKRAARQQKRIGPTLRLVKELAHEIIMLFKKFSPVPLAGVLTQQAIFSQPTQTQKRLKTDHGAKRV